MPVESHASPNRNIPTCSTRNGGGGPMFVSLVFFLRAMGLFVDYFGQRMLYEVGGRDKTNLVLRFSLLRSSTHM